MAAETETRHFRTLFISDVHLGSKAAKTDFLLDFLKYHEADTIVLVGDIIDGWRPSPQLVLAAGLQRRGPKLLRKARKVRASSTFPETMTNSCGEFPGTHFAASKSAERMIHEAADGRKYLVLHGDEFDVVVRNARLLAYLGDWAYDAAIAVNVAIAAVRRRIGLPYWFFRPGQSCR